MVTTLCIIRITPRLGAFITVVASCRRTVLSPLFEVLHLPAAEAARVVKSSILHRSCQQDDIRTPISTSSLPSYLLDKQVSLLVHFSFLVD